MQFARLQASDAGTRLDHEFDGHGIDAGNLIAAESINVLVAGIWRVAVEAFHLDRAVIYEFDQLEGAGADRRHLHRRRVCDFTRYDDDRDTERTQVLDERRLRLLQGHLEGAGIRRLIFGDDREDRAIDADLHVTVKRRHDIVGGHGLAVMELDALTKLECVGQAIGTFGHGFRQLRDRAEVLVARHQRLKHVHRDVAGGDCRGGVLVQAVRLRLLTKHHVAALPGTLMLGLGAGGADQQRCSSGRGSK